MDNYHYGNLLAILYDRAYSFISRKGLAWSVKLL